MRRFIGVFAAGLAALGLIACQPKAGRQEVVVYTSVDQVYAEPVFKAFERASGIKVLAVYDAEAAKTSGLVNRLIAETAKPQADVFWNSEFAQTIALKEKGVFAPIRPASAADIPEQFKDPQGYWYGFGARARVLIVNTEAYPQGGPSSVFEFMDSKTASKKWGMAYPLFGTTLTQAAAMYVLLGDAAAQDFYQRLKDRGIRIVDGNSVVRDMVVSGELSAGLTDTDDACSAVKGGKPVRVVFPDSGPNSIGTLFIPNTAAMVKNGPHPAQAKELLEYLLSDEVEGRLIDAGFFQLPVHSKYSRPACFPIAGAKEMKVSYADIAGRVQQAARQLREIFVK